jgi:hypothetical protein
MSLVLSRLRRTLQEFFATEGGFDLKEISTPANPPSGYVRVYAKPDGKLYRLGEDGTESRVGDGAALPIGSIIAHYSGAVGNAEDLSACRANGWAVCDGTTPASQGISDAVITDATPNLNGEGRFLRGGSSAGVEQDHQMQSHTHSYVQGYANADTAAGGGNTGLTSAASQTTGTNTGNSASETRPINMSVIWLMRVK